MAVITIKSKNSDNQAIVTTDGRLLVSGDGPSGGNPSVGTNGDTAPDMSTEIAGIDPDGNLKPVSVDANGFVNVNGTSVVTGTVTTHEAGLNTFKTSQYTIGTVEIQLTPTPLSNRSSICLKVVDIGANTIFFCQTPGAALTDGFPLKSGDNVQLDLTSSGVIYAVSTAPGQLLYVLEIA